MPISEFPRLPTDRRDHLRTEVHYDIDLEYYSLDGQRLGAGYGETVNVSAGGMMIETEKALEPSMQVVVQIITPLFMFMATGSVVHMRQMDEHTFRAGIRFNQVINAEWEVGAVSSTTTST